MAGNNKAGYFPVQSVSDGKVENIGWLTLGGYRIGIRSKHGAYFYYAHLDSYAKDLKKGDDVKAGEVIGYMGNTGYGEEGTKGQFEVHLHFGVYIDFDGEQFSVNPFPILKYLEPYRKVFYPNNKM
jgi:murein DD-endopeptidase MepM/ murein hydrolase activator NlpD